MKVGMSRDYIANLKMEIIIVLSKTNVDINDIIYNEMLNKYYMKAFILPKCNKLNTHTSRTCYLNFLSQPFFKKI